MGRREKPVDPNAGPIEWFADQLRVLRQSSGVTYRAMAQRVDYSAPALSQAAAGRQLPSLNVTLAYVTACGGDLQEWGAAVAPDRTGGGVHEVPGLAVFAGRRAEYGLWPTRDGFDVGVGRGCQRHAALPRFAAIEFSSVPATWVSTVPARIALISLARQVAW